MRFPILRFGVVSAAESVGSSTFRADLEKVGRALGYSLGTTVQCRIVSKHAQLTALLSQNQVDAAWVPPVVALDCVEKRIARPRIALVRQKETTYHAVLFSLEGAAVKSLADLQNIRVAWVSPESASGYLVPLASLRTRGMAQSKAFSSQVFFGSHEAVSRAVAEGKADVGASFAHFESANMRELVSASWTECKLDAQFRVLLSAGPIPTDVIVTHRSMDDGHQQALVSAFSGLLSKPEHAEASNAVFQCDGFTGCGDEHLGGLSKLIRLLDRRS